MAVAGACGHESPPELVRLTHRDAFSVFFNATWSYSYYICRAWYGFLIVLPVDPRDYLAFFFYFPYNLIFYIQLLQMKLHLIISSNQLKVLVRETSIPNSLYNLF